MFSNMIGLNDFRELYDSLFGFGITIVVDVLKCEGQKPSSRQVLAILVIFFKHVESLRIYLRYLHTSLLEPSIDKLLHLINALVTFSSENKFYDEFINDFNSLRTSSLITWCWAVLKVECSTCYRLSILIYGWPLYLITSIGSSLYLLI